MICSAPGSSGKHIPILNLDTHILLKSLTADQLTREEYQVLNTDKREGEDRWLAWVEGPVRRSHCREQRTFDRCPELVSRGPASERDRLRRHDNAEAG